MRKTSYAQNFCPPESPHNIYIYIFKTVKIIKKNIQVGTQNKGCIGRAASYPKNDRVPVRIESDISLFGQFIKISLTNG